MSSLSKYFFILLIINQSLPAKLSAGQNRKKIQKKSEKKFKTASRLCAVYHLSSRYCYPKRIKIPKFSKFSKKVKTAQNHVFHNFNSLKTSLRFSSLLPDISINWGRYDDTDRSLSAAPGQENYWDENNGIRQVFQIRAKWDLKRLLFDRNDIIILKEKRKNFEIVQKKITLCRRTFFRWKKLLLIYMMNPSLRLLIELEEREAVLDRLSAGGFNLLLR
ncbi:MAG: hypothetical protein ACQES9_00370 [Myxococcota bacterium]